MGGSYWSNDVYTDRVDYNKSAGKSAFAYNDHVATTGVRKVHEKMDPKGVTRESRDSPEHPESVAIAVLFDVTGSMHRVPTVLQTQLKKLMNLLLEKGLIAHPQMLFGAIGDYTSDEVPLQVGQFESGIEMDDDLGRLYLEGGGGGSQHESYQDAFYFIARHTVTDCWEKRGKKGYLFVIGDEKTYPAIRKHEALDIFGDNIEGDIPVVDLIRECQERYEVFFIIPKEGSYSHDPSFRESWVELVGGEHVLSLEKAEGVCDSIALAIGLIEGSIDLQQGTDHLASMGTAKGVIDDVIKQLDPLAKKTALAKSGSGNLPTRASSVARL
jgi:hypothetical protein